MLLRAINRICVYLLCIDLLLSDVTLCYPFKMTEDTSSLGSSITTSGDDLCEPEVDDDVPTLQKTLEMLSLSEYASTFEKERIDMESLVQ